MNEMDIKQLITQWSVTLPQEVASLSVNKLVLDSRKVGRGDIFIAVPGYLADGRKFISNAIDSGASAVIAQSDEIHLHGHIAFERSTPIIYLDDLSNQLSELASKRFPLHKMKVVGVTGTNGKTTITQIVAQWLNLIEEKSAVMGTAGNGFLDDLQPALNTTGSAIEIYETMSQLEAQGAVVTALETSSHGLVQGRVKALPFAAALFTNLSRDHLDYHGNMEAYEQAKYSLFCDHDCQIKVINADDKIGQKWLNQLPEAIAVSTQSSQKQSKAMWATNVLYSEKGIQLHFSGNWGEGQLSIPLIGEFNANNVLLAFTTLLAMGYNKDKLIQSASKLAPVIGRMELFQRSDKAKIVVDYAHTPDALEKALQALKIHCQGKLWVIFGCGGDRDKGKRPMMAEIAEKHADRVIMTDDNPRSEDPSLIIQDMMQGLKHPENAMVEHNRFDALNVALSSAKSQDIILLAGKGHEDYQVFAHETIYSSDRDNAQQLLGLAKESGTIRDNSND